MSKGVTQDKLLHFRLNSELKTRFEEFCRARQINPAAFIRAAITEKMGRVEGKEKP